MAGIDLGGIYADLDIRTGNLDKGLAKARQALEAVDKEIAQLQSDFDKGAISIGAYTARSMALTMTQNDLTAAMHAAYTATTTLSTGLEILNQRAAGVVQGSGRMGQAMMQLGYIADDLQYGFSGIVNNIAPLVYGLSGSTGLAAATQLAAVAVFQLYTHWDQFTELLGFSVVRTESEEMEKLAKATSRTADEQLRLNKYKKEEKEIAQMLGGETKSQKDTKKAVQDIYDEADPNKLASTLAAQMKAPLTPAQQEKLDNAQLRRLSIKNNVEPFFDVGDKADKELAATQQAVEDERNAEAQDRAQKLMNRAKQDDAEGAQSRQSIMSKLGRLGPDSPFADTAMQLAGAGPEGQAREQKAAADAAVRKANEDTEEARKKAAKEAQKKADDALRTHRRGQDAAEQRAVGRLGFLRKSSAEGLTTDDEEDELGRLEDEDLRKKRKSKDSSEQKAIGRLGFLRRSSVEGLTTDDEETELDRLEEADKKKKDNEAEQQDREANAARKKNEKDAREASPGIKEQSEILATMVAGGALTADKARDMISDQLGRDGVGPIGRTNAAGDIFKDAQGEAEKDATHRALNERSKTSQVFDANSLAAQFQSSVGGDEAKKQTGLLEKMQKDLDQMVKMGWVPNFN